MRGKTSKLLRKVALKMRTREKVAKSGATPNRVHREVKRKWNQTPRNLREMVKLAYIRYLRPEVAA